ncbi:hypothetical protein JF540_26535 [Salipiger thiooxidans]|nr:hypothetical protein [Salipiger thiooxidans]
MDAWTNQPVSKLDTHPLFSLMPVEVRQLPDGTTVRNYVNGVDMSRCKGGSYASSYSPNTLAVSGNATCFSSFAACNNTFYIKNGRVLRYLPVGSGGAYCYTDERTTPDGWRGKNLNGVVM